MTPDATFQAEARAASACLPRPGLAVLHSIFNVSVPLAKQQGTQQIDQGSKSTPGAHTLGPSLAASPTQLNPSLPTSSNDGGQV